MTYPKRHSTWSVIEDAASKAKDGGGARCRPDRPEPENGNMAEPFAFELVSPEKLLLSDDVTMVVVPGAEGDFGVLVGHAPLISPLRPGVIDIVTDIGVCAKLAVAGGLCRSDRRTVHGAGGRSRTGRGYRRVSRRDTSANEAISEADKDTARNAAETELAVAEAMLVVGAGNQWHCAGLVAGLRNSAFFTPSYGIKTLFGKFSRADGGYSA